MAPVLRYHESSLDSSKLDVDEMRESDGISTWEEYGGLVSTKAE